jgi:hypothetical protein
MGTMRPALLFFFSVTAVSSFLFVGAGCGGDEASIASEDDDLGGTKNCNVSTVTCEITPPQCPEGKTPSVRGSCYGPCVAIAQCKIGTYDCSDGPALCEIVPPTCPAGQTLTTRNGCFGPCVPSGVCIGAGGSTGGSTSGSGGTADCDVSAILCEITPPQCPDGQTATRDGDCYGPCVPHAKCKDRSYRCSEGPALCEIVPPTCPAGQTLTTTGGCFGPCVPSRICK